jgi:cell division protein FtsN
VAPTEASYRISVAAVRNPEGANRLRAELANQGFPAFIGRQGELYLVLVGPYRTRTEADQVAARLRAAGQETVIFFFPGGTPAPAPAAPAPAAPAPPAAAPAEGELRFLQVGAYATAEGARPQIERLQALGYTVTQRRTEGGLIRLLIGPFNPSELLTARNRLDDQGIEHFVTR